jgi:hypothetical protein
MGLDDTPGIGPIFSAVSKFFGGDGSSGEKTHRSFLKDANIPELGGIAFSDPHVQPHIVQRDEWRTGRHLDREGAPAVTETDLKTGVVTREEWWKNGEYDRKDGGPAFVTRDPNTGEVTSEEWYQNGWEHRDNGPSSIGYGRGKDNRDPITDAPLHQYWSIHGKSIDPPEVMPQQTPYSSAQIPHGQTADTIADSIRSTATRPRSPAP